jgi:hypothetical protein
MSAEHGCSKQLVTFPVPVYGCCALSVLSRPIVGGNIQQSGKGW